VPSANNEQGGKLLARHANVYSYTRSRRGGPGGGKGAAMSALARGPDANLGKFISSANSNGAVIKAFFIF